MMTMMALRAVRPVFACLAIALLGLFPRHEARAAVPEYELKAAFIYNFIVFTDWPVNTLFEGDVLNVCINPSSLLLQAVSRLSGSTVKGKRFGVRHLAGLDGIGACHVVIVDRSDRERWPQIRKRLAGSSVLSISDDAAIGLDGTVISLGMQSNRIVFDVDAGVAREARLVLSSKLLRLARAVQ